MDQHQPSAGVHDLDFYFGCDFVDVHSCDMLRRRLHPDQGSDDLDDVDERTDLFAHRRKPKPDVRSTTLKRLRWHDSSLRRLQGH